MVTCVNCWDANLLEAPTADDLKAARFCKNCGTEIMQVFGGDEIEQEDS